MLRSGLVEAAGHVGALPALLFADGVERFAQQPVEAIPHELDDHRLPQRLGLPRLVRAAVA